MTITQAGVRGRAIAFARDLADLTQNELAAEIGVSHQTLRRTEHGDRSPRFEEVEAIAKATGVPYEWLMNPDTFLPPTVELGPLLNSPDLPAHNVHDLDAHGQVIEGPWGDGPDGGTPVQMRLPRAA